MGTFLKNITTNPFFLRLGARLSLQFAPKLQIGNAVIFSRWADVKEIFKRDLDFVIEPINKERIERVNGPFILGMDRNTTQLYERQALYKAMNVNDLPRVYDLATEHAKTILGQIQKGESFDIINSYARRIASRNATVLTGVSGPSEKVQMQVARAMFHELFLNLDGDETVRAKAINASKDLRLWCADNIAYRREHSCDDMIGRLLSQEEVDEDCIRRIVSGMFVGAVDTTATCVAQILFVILTRPAMHRAVMNDLDNIRRMRGWCWEALRFWPHNPIVLRQAARDTQIGDTEIRSGTRVVCFTLAAMHDDGAFPRAHIADPTRDESLYFHFGGGFHPCAGRSVNAVQIPVLVREVLMRKPQIVEKITFDGPFPDRFLLKLAA